MKKEKINNGDFIKQVSKKTGYAQKDIAAVFSAAADILIQNLRNNLETAVFKSMVVYPARYTGRNENITFPRARFGTYFKNFAPVS